MGKYSFHGVFVKFLIKTPFRARPIDTWRHVHDPAGGESYLIRKSLGEIMKALVSIGAAAGAVALVLAGCSSTTSNPDATETSNPDATENAAVGAECILGNKGPGGGTIFYNGNTSTTTDLCFEAAPDKWDEGKQSSNVRWCTRKDSPVTKEDTSVDIGQGAANTQIMITKCKESGASLANAYSPTGDEGTTPWFLPSRGELMQLNSYSQKNKASAIALTDGEFLMSSSAGGSGFWFVYGNAISEVSEVSGGSGHVRPVRSF
jgi:hypothetical protein